MIKNGDAETEHNLMICGDSYTRAFRDVLASHFGTVLYLYYDMMGDVNIDELIDEYNIDVFLYSGWGELFNSEDYVFSFSDGER